MIRRTALALFLGFGIVSSAYSFGEVAHAASYTDCTNNPGSCTGGTTCRTFPKNVVTGSGSDTSPVGVCLLDTQYQIILKGLSTNPTQTNTAGSPNPTQTNTAGTVTNGPTQLTNPLKYDSLDSLLQGVLKSLIDIGSILLTLALVWVGFKFVAARGNEEAIRSARTALMWTVIGGLILLGATAIESVISATVNSISA